ncbi:MAG: SDR family NAD(P)-dependent oxidoreductase [Vicinamibacterales bacterium]
MALNVVVVGATKGIGRALARRLVARGDRLHLLGRDLEDLARCAADLQARATAGGAVSYSRCDLEEPDGFQDAVSAAAEALGGFDTFVITAGLFATQPVLEDDLAFTRRLLTVNYAHTVLLCEHVRRYLLAKGGGTLCVFSSVAGDRGRKPVILYGSSKAGLSAYLEGLDHKFREAGLKTICVKPGFVRTGMTDGLPEPPFAADPDQVAASVVKAIDAGTPMIYAPPIWGLVMLVIRNLPRVVMRKIKF